MRAPTVKPADTDCLESPAMSKILLAWEVGADYGHLMRYVLLARELARRGHEPVLALKDLTHVETLLRGEPWTVLQAPVWQAQVSGLAPPEGFAETLLRIGFLHPQALAGVVRAWRALVAMVAPDMVLFDYAPTALLATRGLPLKRVVFGDPFSSPPRCQPMPTYRWWRPEPPGRAADAERHTLAGANAVLAKLGQPPLARLADLLDADDEILCGHAEFDPYPQREGGHYHGALAATPQGATPSWPDTGVAGAKKVFAYLKPLARDFDAVLRALARSDASVVVHAPGISTKLLRAHLAANIRFSAEPLRMDTVCREANLGICHAGAGTVQALVGSGLPLLLLPQHLEQTMTARRALALGVGLMADTDKPPPDFNRLLRRLLEEPGFAESARAVAARWVEDDPATRAERIVDRLEALLASDGR